MGFLPKKEFEAAPRDFGTTVISEGAAFTGELKVEAKLHIDGRFEGDINSTNDVSIGANGHFEGTIVARRLLVSGHAKGNFDCDRLEIIETGKVFGDVVSEDFIIEPGGRFVGGSRNKSDEPVAALSHMKAEKPSDKTADEKPAAKSAEADKA